MQTKTSRLWGITILTVIAATAMILGTGIPTRDSLVLLLPWIGGLVLALFIARTWGTRGMMPPPEPTYPVDPLFLKDTFALSGAQFFPVRPGYAEDAPQPPVRKSYAVPRVISWAALIMGGVGCLVPPFLIAFSLFSLLPCVFLYASRSAFPWKELPTSIRRRILTAFCLGMGGIWSGVMMVYLSVAVLG